MDQGKFNALKNEKSPYLRQHATNPVNWFPWCSQAFKKAKEEDKPIFLSIGYSTCHWCHVMEEESFEDEEIAGLLNKYFVSIKVDREERPDIDNTYMSVAAILSNTSGWPLNIVMSPDRKPFFASTYIPKEDRYGRIGLKKLLPHINKIWNEKREEVNKSADKLCSALIKASKYSHKEDIDKDIFKKTFERLSELFDPEFGGFGKKPKFPTPKNLMFMLQYWYYSNETEALKIAESTLNAMMEGGIWDHVGYGFHRYSTDRKWKVPHFEKMLYDQALLSEAYLEGFLATENEEYRDIVQDIFVFILRDMTSDGGGFYSAIDADSEGQEGKYYLWDYNEIINLLDKEDAELIIKMFDIRKNGNFVDEISNEFNGKNIFYKNKGLKDLSKDLKIPEWELKEQAREILEKLYLERKKRIHPLIDKKILTDWNGLMIASMAKGARVLQRQIFMENAKNAADFILKNMVKGGILYHSYCEGEIRGEGNIEDYAFFILGLIELYQSSFNLRYLKEALKLNETLINLFWDEKNGGFFYTPKNRKPIIYRQKESNDGAIPSGNSIALFNLVKLAKLSSNESLLEKAEKIPKAFSRYIKQSLESHTAMLAAMMLMHHDSYEIIICGDKYSDKTEEMLHYLYKHYIPNKIVVLKPSEQDNSELDKITGFTKNYKCFEDKPTAYVCTNFECKTPTTDYKKMLELLGQ